MTRRTVGGPVDYHLLARLHRPADDETLRREALRLAAEGLQPADIAQAIGVHRAQVDGWLVEVRA